MKRRHVFNRIASKRDEREDRCRRCGVSRVMVGILTNVHEVTRWMWLYRPHGGIDWTTRPLGCAS